MEGDSCSLIVDQGLVWRDSFKTVTHLFVSFEGTHVGLVAGAKGNNLFWIHDFLAFEEFAGATGSGQPSPLRPCSQYVGWRVGQTMVTSQRV